MPSLKINENEKDINFRVSDLLRVSTLIPVKSASRLASKKLLFLDSFCIKHKNSGQKYIWVHLGRASLQYISTESKSTIITQVACVASVSVRFSARSRHFLFLSRAKIGASAKKCVTIFPRPKSEKCIERAESLTETLATQAITQANERFIGCNFVQQFYIHHIKDQ